MAAFTLTRRSLIGSAGAGILAAATPIARARDTLRIQRLAWAGVHLKLGNASLFIDPLTNANVWEKSLPDTLVPVVPSAENFVLITHRHPDHFDSTAIRAALGSTGTLAYPASSGSPPAIDVRLRAAALFEPQILGDFTATAVPASDGYGDPQVSWVVAAGGKRIIHCGDTQWHGSWWHIGRQQGPFDAAFLPINGARFSWRKPVSEIPAVLTPEQAVAAAVILGAKRLVPIHFGISGADGYAETEDPLAQLKTVARRRNIVIEHLRPGDWLDLD